MEPQRTDFDLADPANTSLGRRQVQRWNLLEGWGISKHPAHPALVSEADFIAAQDTTATGRDPARPKNTCIREDQILAHLAAIAILMHRPRQAQSSSRRALAPVTTPAQAAVLIDTLRTAGVTLTYDPAQQTLRCSDDIAVTIGNGR